MPKLIKIEYWVSWGYGIPSRRLRDHLKAIFLEAEIQCQAAETFTKKIEVSWMTGEGKKVVWAEDRKLTEISHDKIIERLKG